MQEAVVVFCGGGIGAALRYWMTGDVDRCTGTGFPHGTLIVNSIGSLLINVVTGVFEERFAVQSVFRLFHTVGS